MGDRRRQVAIAACFGLAMGVLGMIGGLSGAVLGGLEGGDTSGMPAKALWGLLLTLAPLLGLGVGMILRHSAAAVSILLVWVFVLENLIRTLIPANAAGSCRSVPPTACSAPGATDTPETIAAALSRMQDALLFGGYAAGAARRRDGTVLPAGHELIVGSRRRGERVGRCCTVGVSAWASAFPSWTNRPRWWTSVWQPKRTGGTASSCGTT